MLPAPLEATDSLTSHSFQYEVVFSESFISSDEATNLLYPWLQKSEPDYSDMPPPDELAQKVLSGDFSFLTDALEGKGKTTYEQMVLNERGYLCAIPWVAPSSLDNDTASAISPDEKQKELLRASDHGVELLKGMQGQCIYYAAGWWMYSFCYNEGVKQFHPMPQGRGVPSYPPVEDKSVHSFHLGRIESGSTSKKEQNSDEPETTTVAEHRHKTSPSTELQTQGQTNYLVQKLGGGTLCDLTGQLRRIEVQFHCSNTPQDRISMIKETASCVYLMVINTPRLCNDVAFMPPQVDKPNIITCQEIIDDDKVEEWKVRKGAHAASQFTAEGAPVEQIKRLTVGGIVVGGQKLVGGSVDRTIKVSNAMAAAQQAAQQLASAKSTKQAAVTGDKFVATLAKSDGTFTSVITEKQLKKYGLEGDKKDLQKWVEEVKALAGDGVPWKLDVYDTNEGMEFRAIYGEEDSEDDEKDAAAKTEKSVGHQAKKAEAGDDAGEGSEEVYKKKAPTRRQP